MAKVSRLLIIISIAAVLAMTFVSCAPKYKLSISSSPEASGTVDPTSGRYGKNVAVDVVATPASGYRFDHWEGSATGTSSTISLTMDGDKSLAAHFTKLYTLSTTDTPTNGGSVVDRQR